MTEYKRISFLTNISINWFTIKIIAITEDKLKNELLLPDNIFKKTMSESLELLEKPLNDIFKFSEYNKQKVTVKYEDTITTESYKIETKHVNFFICDCYQREHYKKMFCTSESIFIRLIYLLFIFRLIEDNDTLVKLFELYENNLISKDILLSTISYRLAWEMNCFLYEEKFWDFEKKVYEKLNHDLNFNQFLIKYLDKIYTYNVFNQEKQGSLFSSYLIISKNVNVEVNYKIFDNAEINGKNTEKIILSEEEIQQLSKIIATKQWRFSSLYNFDLNFCKETNFIEKYLNVNSNYILNAIFLEFIKSTKNIELYQISFEDQGNNMSNLKNLFWFLKLIPKISIVSLETFTITKQDSSELEKTVEPGLSLLYGDEQDVFELTEESVLNLLYGDISYDEKSTIIVSNTHNWFRKLNCKIGDNIEISFRNNDSGTLDIIYGNIILLEQSNNVRIKSISDFTKSYRNCYFSVINKVSKLFTHKVLGRTLFITNFLNDNINIVNCFKFKKTNESIDDLEHEKNMIESFRNKTKIIDYLGNKPHLINSNSNQFISWINREWFELIFENNKKDEDFSLDLDVYLYYQIKNSKSLSPVYFTYYLEEEEDDNLFFSGCEICLTQVGKLLTTEYYHSSLINLFHNKADGRKYTFIADNVVSQQGRYGYGKLSRFFLIGRFSNMRLIGIADFAEIKLKNENTYASNESVNEFEILLNNFFSWVILIINRRMLLHYTNDLSLKDIDMKWNFSYCQAKNILPDNHLSCFGELLKWGLKLMLENYTSSTSINLDEFNFELAARQIDYFTSRQYIDDITNNNSKFAKEELYLHASVNMPKVLSVKNICEKNGVVFNKENIEKYYKLIPRGWVKIFLFHEETITELDFGWMSALIFVTNASFKKMFTRPFKFINFIGDASEGGICILLEITEVLSDTVSILWKILYKYIDGGAANGSFPFFEILKIAHISCFRAIFNKHSMSDLINFDNIHLLENKINDCASLITTNEKIYYKNHVLFMLNNSLHLTEFKHIFNEGYKMLLGTGTEKEFNQSCKMYSNYSDIIYRILPKNIKKHIENCRYIIAYIDCLLINFPDAILIEKLITLHFQMFFILFLRQIYKDTIIYPIQSTTNILLINVEKINIQRINEKLLNLDVIDDMGRTPLIKAVINDQYYIVLELLCNRCTYKIQDFYGKTAFVYALEKENPNIKLIILFLEHIYYRLYFTLDIEEFSYNENTLLLKFKESIMKKEKTEEILKFNYIYEKITETIFKLSKEEEKEFVDETGKFDEELVNKLENQFIRDPIEKTFDEHKIISFNVVKEELFYIENLIKKHLHTYTNKAKLLNELRDEHLVSATHFTDTHVIPINSVSFLYLLIESINHKDYNLLKTLEKYNETDRFFADVFKEYLTIFS